MLNKEIDLLNDAPQKTSLFERIGGSKAIEATVKKFYSKVLLDPAVNYFFKNVDMKKQEDKLRLFIQMAFGGENKYTGKNMRDGHKGLNIKNQHYDIILRHLQESLQELDVNLALIKEVIAIVETLRPDIVVESNNLMD